ncbi:hypothetical protein AB8615_04945 [Litorimonas sp. RW-G-Af-16]|uniref:hypothetical protein n=1 Tax=Litorimonas sp. RW-G-Af-16 TaxID=3241168 RepID=UPI003AAF0207
MMRVFSTFATTALLIACAPADKMEQMVEAADMQTDVAVDKSPTPPATPRSLRLEDIDFTSYSQELAGVLELERGESRIRAIDKVRLNFAPTGPEILKTAQSSFDRPDGSVLIFSVDGIADDSVRAQEVFLILSGPEGEQVLAEYGMRIKCYRGENTTDWQTNLCP